MSTIVVVDSEPIVRSVVVRILERAGYSVHDSEELGQALLMIENLRPDLVITNVFLRGATGHDAMKIIKDRFPGLNVLMVSGLPDEKVVSEWTGTTGFDVFPKPFKADDLLQKVEQMLFVGD